MWCPYFHLLRSIVPLTRANLIQTLFSYFILSCSSKQIFFTLNLPAPPVFCPLWPFTNTTPFPQRLSPYLSIHFPVLPFHHSLMLKNIVLDCLADAIMLGLCLHNHISYLHSWVLTEARQVKHHTRGDKTMEAHLELRPGLYSAPCHYQKHCWPLFHLANTLVSPSPSSLYILLSSLVSTLVSFNLLYLYPDFCTVISFYPQPRSSRAPSFLHLFLSLRVTFWSHIFYPSFTLSHLLGTVELRDFKMQIHTKRKR